MDPVHEKEAGNMPDQNYIALYRKYRPRDFDDVRGRDAIVRTLKNQIVSGRIGHSYLFCGTRGTGKTTIARIFARAVNCENQHDGNPCGECPTCRAIAAEANLNVTELDAASNNSVDDIRAIVDQVEYSPTQGRFRVFIIDEVHMLSNAAFNALLKTLEEPPEYAVIFLLTENADSLLATIRSRCVMLKLRNIKDKLVKKYLMEQMQVPDYQAELCAAFAQGNIGRAIMLAKSEHFNEIKDEAIQLLKYIDEMELSEIVSAIKVINKYKLEVTDYLDIITIWYRDILLYKATKDVDGLVFGDQLKFIKEKATKSSYEGIETILTSIEKAKVRLKANVNFDLVMELLLLTMKEN